MPDLVIPLDSIDEALLGTLAAANDRTLEAEAAALIAAALQQWAEQAVEQDEHVSF